MKKKDKKSAVQPMPMTVTTVVPLIESAKNLLREEEVTVTAVSDAPNGFIIRGVKTLPVKRILKGRRGLKWYTVRVITATKVTFNNDPNVFDDTAKISTRVHVAVHEDGSVLPTKRTHYDVTLGSSNHEIENVIGQAVRSYYSSWEG